MEILIDSREKRPYKLTGAKKATLPTGDYSVEGFEDKIAIERKSFSDVYSCLTTNRLRFQKQVRRLGEFPCKALLIDTTVSAFLMGHPACELPGDVALRRLFQICVPRGVPISFVDNQGELIVRNLLYQFTLVMDASRRAEAKAQCDQLSGQSSLFNGTEKDV